MSTTTFRLPHASATGWIINRRSDLTWFYSGACLGYLFLAAFLVIPAPAFYLTTTLWITFVDAPHQFATVTRTYLDKEARSRLRWRLFSIVPFMLLGPLMWALGLGVLFGVLATSWATFHIAKQHMGFMFIYKKKARDFAHARLDKYFLLSSLLLPAAWFTLIRYTPLMRHATVRVFTAAALIAYAAFALHYIIRQRGRVKNRPVRLLFATVIPLQWLAFYIAADLPLAPAILVSSVAINMGHSLQYHGLMWFHNHNRYRDKERHGLACSLSRRFLYYAGFSIGLYLLFVATFNLAGSSEWLALAALGPSLTHYFLDSFIWRTREDKELAAALRL